ncbi:MAG: fructose PTS transporter subunit IIB [Anaerolineales bacterium]|jgi:fructose-specific phosphotransferase system IIB component
MKCIVVTGCAVGIAHTYMAAEAMEKAAQKMGLEVHVETQGNVGIEDEVSAEQIENADLVIIASDVGIEKPDRFEGKIVYYGIPADAIKHPKEMYEKAIEFFKEQKGNTT